MKRRLWLSMSILIIITGCGGTAQEGGGRAEFDAYLDGLDAARVENLAWSREERELLPQYAPAFEEQMGEFSQAELERLITPREPREVTAPEAGEDARTLFRLLRTTYGGYPYFGGDETFAPIEEGLLTSLEGAETLTGAELEALLCGALCDVIVDGHFIIGSYSFTTGSDLFVYTVPGLYFAETDGMDTAYVKKTIGPQGQLTHCFAALSHDGTGLPQTARVLGREQSLKWERAGGFEGGDTVGYRRATVSGIPVVESRILYAKEGQPALQEQLEALAASGAEHKKKPVLVVDLRQNQGGDSYYARSWVENFTGRQVQPKVAYFEKCSAPFLKTLEMNPAYALVDPQWKAQYDEKKGQWNWGWQDGVPLENETVVFLLQDKGTGSSGEDFVRYLSTAGHVVRVGTNTAGVLQFGNVCEFYLPHSGLFVRMGSKLAFYDGLEMSEGMGVLPDLWVEGQGALDAVVRMCEYYGLNQPAA